MSHFAAYHRGKDFYLEGKYKQALREFNKIDTKDLTNIDEALIRHYRALCYSHLFKLKKSIENFKKAIKCQPRNIQLYTDMGMTYYFFHDNSRITAWLRCMFRIRSNLHRALEAFEEGLLAAALLQGPENAKLWYYRGYMQELLNDKNQAKKSYQKCLEIDKQIKNLEQSSLFPRVKAIKKSSKKQKNRTTRKLRKKKQNKANQKKNQKTKK